MISVAKFHTLYIESIRWLEPLVSFFYNKIPQYLEILLAMHLKQVCFMTWLLIGWRHPTDKIQMFAMNKWQHLYALKQYWLLQDVWVHQEWIKLIEFLSTFFVCYIWRVKYTRKVMYCNESRSLTSFGGLFSSFWINIEVESNFFSSSLLKLGSWWHDNWKDRQ